MGCDIHIYVERKNNNDVWEAISGANPWISTYKDWTEHADTEERKQYLLNRVAEMEREEPEIFQGWIYDGRNYNLFAILADVRNYYSLRPIDYPRGLPNDVSDVVKQESDDWNGDGHSYSYYTFEELMQFDWDNNYVENEGFVSEEVYKQFKETGNPYPCSKGVGGGNVEKVLNCEMDRIIKNKYSWEKGKSFYTIIKWKESYAEVAEGFLNNIKKYILENNICDIKNYRIVFWFDN